MQPACTQCNGHAGLGLHSATRGRHARRFFWGETRRVWSSPLPRPPLSRAPGPAAYLAGNTRPRLAPAASRGPGASPRPATGPAIGSACQPVTPRPANGGAAGAEVGGAPGRCWGLRAPGRRWGLRAPRSLRGEAPAVPLRAPPTAEPLRRAGAGGQEVAVGCRVALRRSQPNLLALPAAPPCRAGPTRPSPLCLHFCRVWVRGPSHHLRRALHAARRCRRYGTEDKRLGSTLHGAGRHWSS